MKKNSPSPSASTSEILVPQPSVEGVRRLQDAYRRRTGKEISEGDARDILRRVMRFQYLNILTNAPCPDTASTPGSPTTTAR